MEDILVIPSQSIHFLTHFYPATLILVGLLVLGLAATRRELKERSGRLAGWCLLPGVLTFSVFAIGAVFRFDGPMPGGDFAIGLIYALFLAHFPLGVFLSERSGRQWPVVAASSVLWSWITCGTALPAVMCVKGDWL